MSLDPWVWTDEVADRRWALADPQAMVESYASLMGLLRRPAWHARAACRGHGIGEFFPGPNADLRPVRALCASCPVAEACAAAGEHERYGIWAGTSERQRQRARPGRPRSA